MFWIHVRILTGVRIQESANKRKTLEISDVMAGNKKKKKYSVADPGCLSRILIFTYPGSRISDLGSRIQKQQQKRGVKKLVVIPFLHT
jgi:hypothetical protein